MSTAALRYLSAVMREGDLADVVARGSFEHMMANEAEQAAYDWFTDYVQRYNAVPTRQAFEEGTSLPAPEVEEPASYHWDRLIDRYVAQSIRDVSTEAGKLLNEGNDPLAALEVLTSRLISLKVDPSLGSSVIDLRDGYDRVVSEYAARLEGESLDGVPTGWPSLDRWGLVGPGDLFSLVGRTGTGKTYFMLHSALSNWREGLPVLFSTMEMPAAQIELRAACMVTGVPVTPILQGLKLPTHLTDLLEDGLSQLREGSVPFLIVDGKMTATVSDLSMLVSAHRPGAVYMDGAYLYRHPDKRLNRYQRVAENTDLIKEMLLSTRTPGFASWQMSKEAAKKFKRGKQEDVDLEDVGYSDAIPQISTQVALLFQEANMQALVERTMRVLKGRQGQIGTLRLRWDFMGMRFDEIEDEPADGADLVHL